MLTSARSTGSEGERQTEPMAAALFLRMHQEWRQRIRDVLRVVGVDKDALEDLTQDVFLLVWSRNRPEPGWAVKTARSVAANYRKRWYRRYEMPNLKALEETPAPYEDPDDRTAVREALSRVDGAELVVKFELGDVPLHELAHAMGIAKSTAALRVGAVRDELRSVLRESPESPE